MRSIASEIIAQLGAEELRPFLLIFLNVGSGHRFTDCDIPLVINGNRYEPRGFRITDISYSMQNIVDQAQFEIDNIDETLTSDFIGGTPQGSDAVLYGVALDSNYEPAGDSSSSGGYAVTLFEGQIGEWSLDEAQLNCAIVNQLVQWTQRTLSDHSASCRWKEFKGTECGYSGAGTWCDRTYARCSALGNTANFGGFRWLPSIQDKAIWWGRVQGS